MVKRLNRLDEPYYSRPLRPKLEPLRNEQQAMLEGRLRGYARAEEFGRAATKALRPFELTFPLWRVLHALDRLTTWYSDAVAQWEVVEHTGLDKNTVSFLMRRLVLRGLVDRGPDNWCLAYRIWLSTSGEDLMARTRPVM